MILNGNEVHMGLEYTRENMRLRANGIRHLELYMTDGILPIPEAAEKYGVDVRRLRGAVWQENQTGRLSLPIGCSESDVIYDGEELRTWVEMQKR
jgi:hypothetical protein